MAVNQIVLQAWTMVCQIHAKKRSENNVKLREGCVMCTEKLAFVKKEYLQMI